MKGREHFRLNRTGNRSTSVDKGKPEDGRRKGVAFEARMWK